MEFVESKIFTRRVTDLLSESEYLALQEQLIANPEAGTLIPGGGGLRKIRWSGSGRGKRGGTRTIYYHSTALSTILLLIIYAKNERDDISRHELAILSTTARKELPHG
jgi:hypothetical protein